MSTRFAELCRDNALELTENERLIERRSIQDGRTEKDMLLSCAQDIYLGIFFDGTNNNKYRDTPGFSHSNVARLYEAYPGTPAAQTKPSFEVNPKSKATRPIFSDTAFKPKSMKDHDYPYYRKIYVPGVGTPMPDAGDSGTDYQKTGGLAMALLGQARLDWALLQVCKQVHAALTYPAKEPPISLASLLNLQEPVRPVVRMPPLGIMASPVMLAERESVQVSRQLKYEWDKYKRKWDKITVNYDMDAYYRLLADAEQRLAAVVKQHQSDKSKPPLRKIRLSVFGFSRGSAQARAWVNMLAQQWGTALAGLPLQVDFLGIFDTVASVGLVQSVPFMDGHFAWASGHSMAVPLTVKRCAHLVAAFEVRGSFPLDSVCQGDTLPPNCKEVIYPGVHSDVGGGYPPNDQGRAFGPAPEVGDTRKLSQISLAQMYREARMAGVPLASPGDITGFRNANFTIDEQLRKDFNAYIAATRTALEAPGERRKDPGNDPQNMYPTETQPAEPVWQIIRRHHGHLLQWQKTMLERERRGEGGVASLPHLLNSPNASKRQDIEDLREAEQELGKEVAFLRSDDPDKFDILDDPLLNKIREYEAQGVRMEERYLPVIMMLGPLGYFILGATGGLICLDREGVHEAMREKQFQWDTWLKDIWDGKGQLKDANSTHTLFEQYLHDSRAWFKPMMRADMEAIAPDDEKWFALGGREDELEMRKARLKEAIERFRYWNNLPAMHDCEHRLKTLMEEGPIIKGGREPYRLWGYLRHRHIYFCGQRAVALENEENRRRDELQRQEQERKRRLEQDRLDAEEYRMMTGR